MNIVNSRSSLIFYWLKVEVNGWSEKCKATSCSYVGVFRFKRLFPNSCTASGGETWKWKEDTCFYIILHHTWIFTTVCVCFWVNFYIFLHHTLIFTTVCVCFLVNSRGTRWSSRLLAHFLGTSWIAMDHHGPSCFENPPHAPCGIKPWAWHLGEMDQNRSKAEKLNKSGWLSSIILMMSMDVNGNHSAAG